jgi:NADPH2:quinone reductase
MPDMRAAYYTRFGTPRDVLNIGRVPLPALGPDDVRVRMAAAGINPVDWKIMGGLRSAQMPHPVVVPGGDGAGFIDAVGERVAASRMAEHVWVHNGATRRAFGTAAEWCIVPADLAVTLPEGVASDVGACLGIPALTAYRAVLCDGPVAGQTLLVIGGAGGVGNYAVQFAKLHGARVISTVSSPAKAADALAAGADHVVDYHATDAVRQILAFTEGNGVDRIVETNFGGNLALTIAVLRQRGVVSVYGSSADMMPRLPVTELLRKEARLHFVGVLGAPADERERAVHAVSTLLARGALYHRVGAHFTLERAVDAFEAAMAGRLVGKVILTP